MNPQDDDRFLLDIGQEVNGKRSEGLRDAPLSALRPTTLQLLKAMLNPLKIIPAESGLPRYILCT
jgi:hypothetical protein